MIVVLEGLPAAGKTTLARGLSTHGLTVVNESLGRFVPVHGNSDSLQALVFTECLEKYDKAKAARRAVIDRGYPSMLAWDHVAEHLGLARDLRAKQASVQRAMSAGQLFHPDLYVYLTITPQESLRRRRRVEELADVWSGLVGMRHCAEFYDTFFARSDLTSLTCRVDAFRPELEILEQVLASLAARARTDGFDAHCASDLDR